MWHFTKHVKEAIQLNKVQCQFYRKQLIQIGQTNKVPVLNSVFFKLIFSERVTLLFSWFYDWQCPNGMSDSFVEIRLKGECPGAPDSVFHDAKTVAFVPQIKRALKIKDWHALDQLLNQILASLVNPWHNCMLRHLVESMARALWVYQNGQMSGVEKSIYWHYLNGHALFIQQGDQLDKIAFAVQKLGVPILQRELPHIPQIPKK